MLRPDLISALRPLLSTEGTVLSLDAVAEAIGALTVTSEEIDSAFTWLERHGRVIGDPSSGPASTALPSVLASARTLKATLGRTPTSAEIAQHSGLSREAVQRALFFSKILQR